MSDRTIRAIDRASEIGTAVVLVYVAGLLVEAVWLIGI
jgi:hypothetical protein